MGKKAREFRKRNLWLTESVAEYMKLVTDPRDRRGLRHELWVILVLILIGYLNGRTTVCSIERFLRSKKKMLRGLLPLENGIPSHCTFSRILQRLSYEELYHVFLLWIGDILSESHGSEGHVMIDGKGIRASRPSDESKTPYVLNALLDIDGIQLYTGLVKVGEKSNEITAIVPLLKVLDIENMIVTLDAIGTQRAVIRQILHQKGHYILPVKENRKGFLADLRDHFSLCSGYGKASLYSSEIEKEHGRLERRTVTLVPNDELGMGDEDLMSARFTALVHRERTIAKTGLYSEQDVFYISDCCSDPEVFSSIVRRHWKCEAAHWVLDMRFGEDRSTARTGFALENAALLRRIAFNLLQLECRETGIAPASFDTDLSSSRLEAILFKPLRLI